ncbi:PAS domain S-box protein [Alkalihalobacillus sp. MEB130]|uniref:two-component system sensor histidine kinase NtrB n=1 Tax=Alkalihalobacillus sp. MEB130 TaxID=2976704 RepID=UPI0028E010FF|nr:ATP-binding protein [Alkalihalobacillus sp. MEB130]MDT8862333.1 PAS domain S-box protein [Alkalihalobacillus sp. MEB130]
MEVTEIKDDCYVTFLEFLHKRNRLLLIIIWICCFFFLFLDGVFFPEYIWPPVGVITCFSLYLFYRFIPNPVIMMYVMITGIYVYTFVVNWMYPEVGYFMFIFFGVMLASVYQRLDALLYAGVLATTMIVFFFYHSFDDIFVDVDQNEVLTFVIFSCLTIIFFIFHIRFTRELWMKSQKNEYMAKQELETTQAHLDSLFSNVKEGIVLFHEDGKILSCNQAFENLYGYSQVELIDTNIKQIFGGEWKKLLTNSQPFLETEHVTRSKQSIFVNVSISEIATTSEKKVYSAFIQDVTEKRKTEEQVIQAEKLSSVGRLAAGIAHELKNPLTVLIGFVDLLDERSEKKKDLMIAELQRMNMITDELLMLAKPQAVEKRKVDMKQLLDDVLFLYRGFLNQHEIEVSIVTKTKLHSIYAEPNQVKQVLVNVLKNAAEAIGLHGNIEISLEDIDESVVIIVDDDGGGFDSLTLTKIGEPFYTTKKDGTGLGTMIVKKIMSDHRGSVQYKNLSNKGARVILTFPRFSEKLST